MPPFPAFMKPASPHPTAPDSPDTRAIRPYFAAPPGPVGNDRRILLISYHFPPDPAVGGLRWQQMARHFAGKGWSFDVITRDFGGVAGLDAARLATLPPGTRIYSVPDREPVAGRIEALVRPLARTVRSLLPSRNGSAPTGDTLTREQIDQQGGGRALLRGFRARLEYARDRSWAVGAARLGVQLGQRGSYAVVISSGPPHMAHEAGRRVSRRLALRLIVDMRDPWSLVPRFVEAVASPVWVRLASRYEARAVRQASLVTMNTETGRDAMRAAYPDQAAKFEAIRNGCDDDPMPRPPRDHRFRIRFAGSIYADRDPRPVFQAAAKVIRELSLSPSELCIEFVGDVDRYAGTPTAQIASEEGIDAFVSVGKPRARAEALEFLAGATMLLSLPQDSDFSIPAKIYEYLKIDAWMLVLGPSTGATARLLEGTDADVVDAADVPAIATAIRRRLEQFRAGQAPAAIGRDGRFDRSVQADRLLDLIGRLPRATGAADA